MLIYGKLVNQQTKGEEDANQVWGVVTRGACAIDIDCSKGNLVFSVGNEKTSFDSGCVKSIDYVEKDETGAENLIFRFSDECGKGCRT